MALAVQLPAAAGRRHIQTSVWVQRHQSGLGHHRRTLQVCLLSVSFHDVSCHRLLSSTACVSQVMQSPPSVRPSDRHASIVGYRFRDLASFVESRRFRPTPPALGAAVGGVLIEFFFWSLSFSRRSFLEFNQDIWHQKTKFSGSIVWRSLCDPKTPFTRCNRLYNRFDELCK